MRLHHKQLCILCSLRRLTSSWRGTGGVLIKRLHTERGAQLAIKQLKVLGTALTAAFCWDVSPLLCTAHWGVPPHDHHPGCQRPLQCATCTGSAAVCKHRALEAGCCPVERMQPLPPCHNVGCSLRCWVLSLPCAVQLFQWFFSGKKPRLRKWPLPLLDACQAVAPGL